MAHYHFVSEWTFAAPRGDVWRTLLNSLDWPEWWPGVLWVKQIRPGGTDGVGDVRRYAWRSFLPYTLVFDMELLYLEPQRALHGMAEGEVEGLGRWTLTDIGQGTHVHYDWNVRTTRRLVNMLTPLARPLIARNHHAIMRQGALGLARHLGTQLLAEHSRTLR